MSATAESLCTETIDAGGAVVLLPGLLAADLSAVPASDTKRLSQLLRMADQPHVDISQAIGMEDLVAACLKQSNTAAGDLTYRSDFPEGAGKHVLRADPAFQLIDMNNATLTNPALLELTQQESEALLLTLNQHFAEDGITFESHDPQRWYCCFKELPDLKTVAVSAAIGHDVAVCKPTGPDARQWRSKLAEVEMLLYEHPVNVAREQQGLTPVNTLWLWGEGQCTALDINNMNISTDDFYTESLAGFLQLPYDSLQASENANLIAINKIANNVSDDKAYRQSILWLEETIAKNVWQAFKQNQYPVIVFWCGGSQFYRVYATAKNRLFNATWRKPLPLSTFAPVTQPADMV